MIKTIYFKLKSWLFPSKKGKIINWKEVRKKGWALVSPNDIIDITNSHSTTTIKTQIDDSGNSVTDVITK